MKTRIKLLLMVACVVLISFISYRMIRSLSLVSKIKSEYIFDSEIKVASSHGGVSSLDDLKKALYDSECKLTISRRDFFAMKTIPDYDIKINNEIRMLFYKDGKENLVVIAGRDVKQKTYALSAYDWNQIENCFY